MPTTILDLTRANPGTESELVLAALTASAGQPTTLIGYAPQREAVPADADINFIESDGYPPSVASAIATAVRKLSTDDAPISVYSFHRSVVRREEPELTGLGSHIAFQTGARLLPAVPRARRTDEWPNELIELDEALKYLREVLTESGATREPIYKAAIRNLLKAKSHKFDSKSGLPGADTPNLMTILLSNAEEQGMIDQIGREPSVRVRLKGDSTTASRSDVVVESIEAPGKRRSDLFQSILMDGIGLFSDVRELFLERLEEILAAQVGARERPAGVVVKQAIKRTREDAPDTFFRKSNRDLPKDKYPWRKLEGFALLILSRAGIIVDADKEPFSDPSPWAVKSGEFITLPENWKTRVDGELILELVRAQAEVTWADGVDLAGALWCNREDEYIDRIDAAIMYLTAEKGLKVAPITGILGN
ncbi:MAG: hypothetical protein VYA67_27145 [Actinomycetota bacterium]|uniref:Uncharacterized protein n=1 Tax=Mycobacterium lentiflavum TaxID=141349 RepID=A0ABY3UUN2_MYCLN|nr:hypothetical protein [Mycobacterium lentiflavum]MEE3067569.1 hypothetical protein [Actinomycetota bacterium]ULP43296.1 hypothetical protein MJO58_04740 [Mycobacterium lentiflavum]